MNQEDLKFLIDEFNREQQKHHFHIKEAKKCLANMMEIQNEVMELHNGDRSLR